MESIVISVKEFFTTIAAPRGLQLENIERTFREEIAAGKDFEIIVGSESKHFSIPVADLEAYFANKIKPKAPPPPDKGAFDDFMKDGPVVSPAKAPAAKEKAKDVK